MQTITPESFALLCFLVLMQNGRGLADKAPNYIAEKTAMLRSGLDAFAYLDINNMEFVVRYCEKWAIELPSPVAEEWKAQNDAAAELRASGVDL